jgi:hypothetical protein
MFSPAANCPLTSPPTSILYRFPWRRRPDIATLPLLRERVVRERMTTQELIDTHQFIVPGRSVDLIDVVR